MEGWIKSIHKHKHFHACGQSFLRKNRLFYPPRPLSFLLLSPSPPCLPSNTLHVLLLRPDFPCVSGGLPLLALSSIARLNYYAMIVIVTSATNLTGLLGKSPLSCGPENKLPPLSSPDHLACLLRHPQHEHPFNTCLYTQTHTHPWAQPSIAPFKTSRYETPVCSPLMTQSRAEVS
jgi:hypothetical protein